MRLVSLSLSQLSMAARDAFKPLGAVISTDRGEGAVGRVQGGDLRVKSGKSIVKKGVQIKVLHSKCYSTEMLASKCT